MVQAAAVDIPHPNPSPEGEGLRCSMRLLEFAEDRLGAGVLARIVDRAIAREIVGLVGVGVLAETNTQLVKAAGIKVN